MADHFYGVAVGATIGNGQVTVGTSTGSTVIELRVTDGTPGLNKVTLLNALEVIQHHLEKSDAPA